jgi:hypothetical protein
MWVHAWGADNVAKGFLDQDGPNRNEEAQRSFPGAGKGEVNRMKKTLIRIGISLCPIVALLMAGIEVWRIGGGGTLGFPA